MTSQKTIGACALALFSAFAWAEGTNETASAKTVSAAKAEESVEDAATASVDPAGGERPEDPKFKRYQTILDRMPFGPEPENFNPDAPQSGRGGAGGAQDLAAQEAMKSAEEQKMLSSVRVSALNATPSGRIAVGFTDGSAQPANNYYLKVGESRDGWTVKDADMKEMKATLEKGGVEVTLALGEGSSDAKGGAAKGGGAPGRPAPPMMGGRPGRGGLLRSGGGVSAGAPTADAGSAFANLRQKHAMKIAARQEELAQQKAAAEQARADREAALAAANVERERAAQERERAAQEREQQREALQSIQEELRRQREAREKAAADAAAAETSDEGQP